MQTTEDNFFFLSTKGKVFSNGLKEGVLGRVGARSRTMEISIANKITQISGGANHMLALDLHGNIYSWGENKFGQLGHGDIDPLKIPKEMDFFKKDSVAQIYTNDNTSFAVTRKGSLYVWGDNKNNQLGILGEYHHEPRLIINTPWENPKEPKIIMSRTNILPIYCYDQAEEVAFKNSIYDEHLKLIHIEIQKHEAKLQVNVGQISSNLQDDYILKTTQEQYQIVEALKKFENYNIKTINEEAQSLEKELQQIKSQLSEINEKEGQLNKEREAINQEITKMNRMTTRSELEYETKLKEFLRVKELLQANDNIKNTLLKRQNIAEEEKISKSQQVTIINNKDRDMDALLNLLQKVEVNRRNYLRQRYLQTNKADLEKFMDKVTYFFKQICETNLTEIASKSPILIGLTEMINQSNSKLQFIKNELAGFKISSNDEIYSILRSILEILYDNLEIRRKLNDYMQGLVLSSIDRRQQPIKEIPIQRTKVMEFIIKQQQDLQKMSQTQFNAPIVQYKQSMMQVNENKLKPRNFCFTLFS